MDVPTVGERTKKQVSFGLSELVRALKAGPLPATYRTYQRLRKDPTVALCRAVLTASVVAAEWSVESKAGVSEEMVEFVREQFIPVREPLVESAMLGGIDYGFAPFEKVWDYAADGGLRIRKLKPLLQEMTEIETDAVHGRFLGFRQDGVSLPLPNSLNIPFRVEGTNWYGMALLENVRQVCNWWEEANVGANRYDNKIAGSHFVVTYPPDGVCLDETGSEVENAVMARRILTAIEASGSVTVPGEIKSAMKGMDGEPGWKIEVLEDAGGRQPTFIERLRYLDSLKCRAMLVPERAVTEGQQGTLAESEAQAGFAILNAELNHRHITRLVNWHAVDHVLTVNYGQAARGMVWLSPSPLMDDKVAFLREVYRAILANPSGFLEEYGVLDLDAMKEALGVPKVNDGDDEQTGAAGVLAVPGVDANDKQAATVRDVYRGTGVDATQPDGMKPADPTVTSSDEAAAQGAVQGTALNGAQIASIVEICGKVTNGELPKPAAMELIRIAFPLLAVEQVERLVAALAVKPLIEQQASMQAAV